MRSVSRAMVPQKCTPNGRHVYAHRQTGRGTSTAPPLAGAEVAESVAGWGIPPSGRGSAPRRLLAGDTPPPLDLG
jgi:hypothetical protein